MYKNDGARGQVDAFIKTSNIKIKKKFDFILKYIADERNQFIDVDFFVTKQPKDRLRHDATHSMVFGKYYNDDFILDERTVGDIISRHISSECSFHGIGVDIIIESLEGNESKRNSLLKDLWENV